jgi:branched-subunit amino acid aminotransferase/4-amino-4-deoxychorismate lyase
MNDLLTWTTNESLVHDTETDDPLLVADSWLVEDGRARGIELHRRRFTAACAETAAVPDTMVASFWRAALARLPRTGDLFPRVELIGGRRTRLRIRIRQAPRRGTEIKVWVPDLADPRELPRIKGPDLDRLGMLRAAAMDAGADDVLLTTKAGLLLESGTASLLWWEDDTTLCVPDPELPILGGVTARMIREHAAKLGITVVRRQARLDDLYDREVWLVNALHGIRPVTEWVKSPVVAGSAPRAAEWQRRWLESATPLHARYRQPEPARLSQTA